MASLQGAFILICLVSSQVLALSMRSGDERRMVEKRQFGSVGGGSFGGASFGGGVVNGGFSGNGIGGNGVRGGVVNGPINVQKRRRRVKMVTTTTVAPDDEDEFEDVEDNSAQSVPAVKTNMNQKEDRMQAKSSSGYSGQSNYVGGSSQSGYGGGNGGYRGGNNGEPPRNAEVSIYDYLGIRSMLPLYKSMFKELALWQNGVPAMAPPSDGPAPPTNDGEAYGTYNNGYNNGWNGFGGGGLTGIGLGVPGFGGGGVGGVFGRRR